MLPTDYSERTYAGVLGKLIGVYLGRPFEQWPQERIERELGEIRYYVHEKLGVPLVVTDDDITGTFTFFRALADHGFSSDLTSEQIGETWLNSIIPLQSILWWGGIGMSTEHTAWHRLAHGVHAPASGSIALNGKAVAEQIGAQIFIDAWGLLHPGDPAAAADWAARAARVSHDGEAVYGAQAVAAMVAAAFVESDIPAIISAGLGQIPWDCLIRRSADDIASWCAQAPGDWRAVLEKIQDRYGYDKFPGVCHMVPNHALIHLALRQSGGDFSLAQTIVNTAGWDTDCNAGNVGCILGVRNGLAALQVGPDWRTPLADRLWLPTADAGECATDAVRETFKIVSAARRLRGLPQVCPKGGARFHFELPGSVQGFLVDSAPEVRGALSLENQKAPTEGDGTRVLAWNFSRIGPGRMARAFTATFPQPEDFVKTGYVMSACPTLYPGQDVCARVVAPAGNPTPVAVRIVIRFIGENRALQLVRGPAEIVDPGAACLLEWRVPGLGGLPVAGIGLEIASDHPSTGTLLLDWMGWEGAPKNIDLAPGKGIDVWQLAWMNSLAGVSSWTEGDFDLRHDDGEGFFVQGTRDWRDYAFETRVSIRLAETFGLVVRSQGLRRYLALRWSSDGHARLVHRAGPAETILAEASLPLEIDAPHTLRLSIHGDALSAEIDGKPALQATAPEFPEGGGAGFLLGAGSVRIHDAKIFRLP